MANSSYDMLYLVNCGIHKVAPDKEKLKDLDLNELYRTSRKHLLEAIVGMTLKNAGVDLPKVWVDAISKAVRKSILFDAERNQIFAFMEKAGIWYMPLKGVIFKEYYPAVGMRQMSDNDILFDVSFAEDLRDYMVSRGYEIEEFGTDVHDAYHKKPVYNFEMHRALYHEMINEDWVRYYQNVKERLIKDEGNDFGYHFSDEDFYIYILTHEYKHYTINGTGLRSLLDAYVYLNAKEDSLDMSYIERECEKLGIAEFEKQGRELCKKVFSKELAQRNLTEEEKNMLDYYLTSGVYGFMERRMENRFGKFKEETGSTSKLRYAFKRIFPDMDTYRVFYPFFYKHKWLLPVGWAYRLVRWIFVPERRTQIKAEMKVMKKIDLKEE